jgi:prepilin-type N-terminal cleavage/methylation domain-containing protein
MNKLLKQAFTLIELLVVIAIIGILSGLIVVSMSGVTQKANIAKAQVFSNSLRNSLMLNLVSEWKFDQIFGSSAPYTISDSWSGGNIGTLMNGASNACSFTGTLSCPQPVTSGCLSGNCLFFDGVNDYVNCGSSSSLTIVNNFTISIWINTTNKNTKQGIWNSTEYSLEIGDNVGGAGGIAQIAMLQVGIGGAGITNNNVITTGWHHIAYIKNGAGATSKIYLDGVDLFLTNSSFNWSSSGTNYIGYRAASLYPFSGNIDDIRIYSAAISAYQIKEQYYTGLNKLLFSAQITKEGYQQKISELENKTARE